MGMPETMAELRQRIARNISEDLQISARRNFEEYRQRGGTRNFDYFIRRGMQLRKRRLGGIS